MCRRIRRRRRPGGDPAHQRLVGQFQSRFVVEYAIYSAGLWGEIHPGLPVTMSFDGAQPRQTLTLPDVEALFLEIPRRSVCHVTVGHEQEIVHGLEDDRKSFVTDRIPSRHLFEPYSGRDIS